jgi:hypothetical protein
MSRDVRVRDGLVAPVRLAWPGGPKPILGNRRGETGPTVGCGHIYRPDDPAAAEHFGKAIVRGADRKRHTHFDRGAELEELRSAKQYARAADVLRRSLTPICLPDAAVLHGQLECEAGSASRLRHASPSSTAHPESARQIPHRSAGPSCATRTRHGIAMPVRGQPARQSCSSRGHAISHCYLAIYSLRPSSANFRRWDSLTRLGTQITEHESVGFVNAPPPADAHIELQDAGSGGLESSPAGAVSSR